MKITRKTLKPSQRAHGDRESGGTNDIGLLTLFNNVYLSLLLLPFPGKQPHSKEFILNVLM